MQLKELANELNISLENLQNFIYDFGIPLSFCMDDRLKISQPFIDFIKKHDSFLKKYVADRQQLKSVTDIAKNLNIEENMVKDFFVKNGVPEDKLSEIKTHISSFLIHQYIGGNYDFIYQDLPVQVEHNGLIGYPDLYFYTTDMLDPFLNADQKKMWGITKPMGIVLYGPPGSGKTFWAQKIAQMIGYDFIHIFKDYLMSTPSNHSSHFSHFLKSKLNQPKTLLFIDDFDELMSSNSKFQHSDESIELVNSIARLIQKDNSKELVIVGSAEILSVLDEEITSPGRFDLHIPVFPPNVDERIDLILYNLIKGLDETSPLLHILQKSNALNKQFWAEYSKDMRLFSNTMIIDFTQSIKKRLYSIFRKDEKKEIILTPQIILAAYNEAKTKLTTDYIKKCQVFLLEAKQNNEQEFTQRLMEIEHEIFHFIKKDEKINKIGFTASNE